MRRRLYPNPGIRNSPVPTVRCYNGTEPGAVLAASMPFCASVIPDPRLESIGTQDNEITTSHSHALQPLRD
jgi:hypothetical protein